MVILTRPVSQSENFMRSRTASEFYRNFQVIGTYSKEISEDLLFKALRKTLIDYVILACNIFKADDHCYFEPLSKIRYSDVVTVERNRIVDVKFLKKLMKQLISNFTAKSRF